MESTATEKNCVVQEKQRFTFNFDTNNDNRVVFIYFPHLFFVSALGDLGVDIEIMWMLVLVVVYIFPSVFARLFRMWIWVR